MRDLTSIVIVKNEKGYIASLRFNDPRNDIDIANAIKPILYSLIERYVYALDGDE